MNERLIRVLLIKLKVLAVVLVFALVGLFSFSFTTTRAIADDIWKQLGMSKTEGIESVKRSFLNGYLYHYGARNVKNLTLNDRAAIAKDLMTYAKQYVNSREFAAEYQKLRNDAKPSVPEFRAKTKEEVRKEKIAETEKSIKEAEKTMKQLNAEMQRVMQPSIDMFKKLLVEYKEPDSKKIEMFYQGELYQEKRDREDYEKDMIRWSKEYPEDHNQLIKARLQKFLEVSATVDFNAELKVVGGKKKFVNPAYEGKAYDWKQIYRAGKNVIEPAREFAQQWIAEIERK